MGGDIEAGRLKHVIGVGFSHLPAPPPDPATFPGLTDLLDPRVDDDTLLVWAPELVRFLRDDFDPVVADRLAAADTGSLEEVLRRHTDSSVDEIDARWVAWMRRNERPMSLLDVGRWLAPWMSRSKGLIGLAAAATAYTAAFSIILPLGFKLLIDEGIGSGSRSRLGAIFLGLFALFLVNTAAVVARDATGARLSARVQQRLRTTMFGNLVRASGDYFEHRPPGDLAARFSSDVERLEDVIARLVPNVIATVISLVGSLLVIVGLDWRLAVTSLVLVPLCLIGPLVFGPRTGRAAEREVNSLGRLNDLVVEQVRIRNVVTAFGLERRANSSFTDATQRVATDGVQTRLYGSLIGASIDMSMTVIQLVGFGVGALLVLEGQLEIGALIAFQGLVTNVAAPLLSFGEINEASRRASGVVRRVDDLLTVPQEPAGTVEIAGVDATTFEEVGFRYANGRGIDEIDLAVSPGKRVAIVGASGSGKSTLLALLLRERQPTSGRISVDGTDLRDIDPESWRAQLGVVFQDAQLFEGTVADNIRVGRPDATDDDLAAAARAAGLDDSDAVWLDTRVHVGGSGLSGGQRQRICIARALVRRPRLLVLDEPTSALDPESAAAVTSTLASLSRDLSVVLVTHHLGLARIADETVVMAGGQIVERGAYDDLVDAHGPFAAACRAQNASGALPAGVTDRAPAVLTPEVVVTLNTVELTAGETLFRAGDGSDVAYLVESGSVTVSVAGPDGDVDVRLLAPGDLVGEVGVLQGVARSATVRATTDTRLLVVPPALVRELAAAPSGLSARSVRTQPLAASGRTT